LLGEVMGKLDVAARTNAPQECAVRRRDICRTRWSPQQSSCAPIDNAPAPVLSFVVGVAFSNVAAALIDMLRRVEIRPASVKRR
jgi:hypothetical protein